MEYEFKRCSRHCAKTERAFEPGETFYSLLQVEGAEVVRYDYCEQAWEGPPEDALGWWKSVMPLPSANKLHWAPNDVMLGLFDELEAQPERADLRYVLTLLLVRRRVMRLEESEHDEEGRELMVAHCGRRDATYRVLVQSPTEQRIAEIQDHLAQLLFADAT